MYEVDASSEFFGGDALVGIAGGKVKALEFAAGEVEEAEAGLLTQCLCKLYADKILGRIRDQAKLIV